LNVTVEPVAGVVYPAAGPAVIVTAPVLLVEALKVAAPVAVGPVNVTVAGVTVPTEVAELERGTLKVKPGTGTWVELNTGLLCESSG
jgi:hypothetical protein